MTNTQNSGGYPPACPPPPPEQSLPDRFQMPARAVDTHAHVIGSPPDHPYVPTRSYTPTSATVESYLEVLDRTGIAYGVVVQVSVHGTDNGLMVEALRKHPARLRGVAVMPLGLSDRAYEEASVAGVVGLRLNELYGGGIGFDAIESYDSLAVEHGWHIELLLDARRLPALMPRLRSMRSPVIIDHMGHMPVSAGVAHPGFQSLVGLVQDGAWVKLSGAYRISADDTHWRDTIPFTQSLVGAGARRCVWGSDWPHVAHWGYMMQVAELLNLLDECAPDSETRDQILVHNPARFYGFPLT